MSSQYLMAITNAFNISQGVPTPEAVAVPNARPGDTILSVVVIASSGSPYAPVGTDVTNDFVGPVQSISPLGNINFSGPYIIQQGGNASSTGLSGATLLALMQHP